MRQTIPGYLKKSLTLLRIIGLSGAGCVFVLVCVLCIYLGGQHRQRWHRAGPRRTAAATRPGAGVRSAGWRAAAAASFKGSSRGRRTGDGGCCHSPIAFVLMFLFCLVLFYARELQRDKHTNTHAAISRAGCTGAQSLHTLRTVIRGGAKDSGASGREGGGVCAPVWVRVWHAAFKVSS